MFSLILCGLAESFPPISPIKWGEIILYIIFFVAYMIIVIWENRGNRGNWGNRGNFLDFRGFPLVAYRGNYWGNWGNRGNFLDFRGVAGVLPDLFALRRDC